MKPYGRIDFVHGGSYRKLCHWKKDHHCHDKNHRKIVTWWEDFSSNCRSRSAIKRLWKKKINDDLKDL